MHFQIVRALEPAHEAAAGAARLVSLLSASNCLGRLGGAALSEACARWRVARTAPLVLACVLMGCSMACVGAGRRALLLPACAVGGLAFGALNCLNPVVIHAVYGPKAFGAIYTSIVIAGALSSVSLSSGLAVWVYNTHAVLSDEPRRPSSRLRAADAPPPRVCIGPECFRMSALCCMGLCAIGAAAAALLTWRVQRPRRRPPPRKLSHDGSEGGAEARDAGRNGGPRANGQLASLEAGEGPAPPSAPLGAVLAAGSAGAALDLGAPATAAAAPAARGGAGGGDSRQRRAGADGSALL